MPGLLITYINNISAPIHFSPMPDTQRKNNQISIPDMANQTIIPNPVTPLPLSVCNKRFSMYPRIFAIHKIFVNPGINHLSGIFIQPFQFPYRTLRIFHPVAGHKPSISFTSSWEYVFGFSTYS